MDQVLYTSPDTGNKIALTQALRPAIVTAGNGRVGYHDLTEAFLQVSVTPSGGSQTTAKQSAQGPYANALYGGEFVPSELLAGMETYLNADIAIAATSMVVEASTVVVEGVERNIFVADRPYLLMNRKPMPWESVWDTGVDDNGFLKPAAEVIYIDSGYTSGTTITISRPDPSAAARKRFAVLQPLVGVSASYGDVADKGVIVELERPLPVTGLTATDGTSQTIDVQWLPSVQQADIARVLSATRTALATTAELYGAYGVTSYYGVFVVKKTGAYKYSVDALPEHCPPSQYDDTGQVDAVFGLDDAALTTVTVDDVEYLDVQALNRYWNPSDCSLNAIDAGDYWVIVKCMNQGTFDAALRLSLGTVIEVTVA